MATFSNNFGAKGAEKGQPNYVCEFCDYKCSKKYSWDRHILTPKHYKATSGNELATKKGQKGQFYCCENCGKEYKDRTGLWRHKKICSKLNKSSQNNAHAIDDKELIMMLIEQNKELMDIVKNGTHHNNNNTTNSHNKAFNLNFFLNETCKNAMNITDFVDSIQLQLSDLEKVGELGYVKGISDIITNNLRALDIDKRPIHCTDKKRETLYIKDENKWEKEDQNNNKLRKVIKKIANKNVTLIQEFKKKYPDCIKSTSQHSDKYNKIIIEAMGGPGDNDLEKEDKIIKNISTVTIIDK